jgi:hypothetical protein
VPSWSWMAYDGEISYHAIPMDGLRKCEFQFRDNERCILVAPLKSISLSHSLTRCEDTNYRIRETNRRLTGWVRYDNDRHHEKAHTLLEYVVIMECPSGLTYGLLVYPEKDQEYRRIGVIAVKGEQAQPEREPVVVI